MTIEEINKGMPVVYIPLYLLGEKKIADNQLGVVSSKNDRYVFVNYKGSNGSQATHPNDLYSINNRPDLQDRLGLEVKPINKVCELWIKENG